MSDFGSLTMIGYVPGGRLKISMPLDRRLDLRPVGASQAQDIADPETLLTLGDDARDENGATTSDREGFFDGEEVTRHRCV